MNTKHTPRTHPEVLSMFVHCKQAEEIRTQFRACCIRGQLTEAQHLRFQHAPTIHRIPATDMDWTFQLVCEQGQLSVAQWLMSLCPSPTPNSMQSFALQRACAQGHTHVAQWLWTTFPPPTPDPLRPAFCQACENGHVNTAQWLLSILCSVPGSTATVEAVVASCFRIACTQPHAAMAEWLFSTGLVSPQHPKCEVAFCLLMERPLPSPAEQHMTHWLLSKCPHLHTL